jgi:hypothetical protein
VTRALSSDLNACCRLIGATLKAHRAQLNKFLTENCHRSQEEGGGHKAARFHSRLNFPMEFRRQSKGRKKKEEDATAAAATTHGPSVAMTKLRCHLKPRKPFGCVREISAQLSETTVAKKESRTQKKAV